MKKQDLVQYKNINQDLVFWIAAFLADKVDKQKLTRGFTDDKKLKSDELIYISRQTFKDKLLNVSDSVLLDEIVTYIRTHGLKALNTFYTPLKKFYDYISELKNIKSIRDIDTNTINVYMELKMPVPKYSEWTRTNYYTHIKSLFKFIDKYSKSDDDFLFCMGTTVVGKKASSPVKSIPKKSLKYLEPDEFIDFILSLPTYKNRHPNPKHPLFLMKVFCFTGARATEIRFMKIEDVSTKIIDKEKYLQIYIHGKGGKDRYSFIQYDLIKDEYEAELEYRKENNICDFLFYTKLHKQYAEKTLYDIVDRYLKNGEIYQPMDSHGLRRSFGSYLLARGVDYKVISELLGHDDEESTEFYAFASKKSFREVRDLVEEMNKQKG
jgi:site-specific recombinase XerD